MSSWWEKRLGTPQAPVRDHNLPTGIGANRPQAVQHYMGQQAPPDPSQEQPTPDGMIDARAAISSWQGGSGMAEAARTGTMTCPRCGSFRFMARTVGSVTTVNGVMAPKPECFECGYPHEQGTLGVSSASVGIVGTGAARQAASAEMGVPWR